MIDEKIGKDLKNRLNKIEGQIRGINKMAADKRYCIDIIRQVNAVISALHKVSEIILANHIETCVTSAFTSKDSKLIHEKIEELINVFASCRIK